MPGIYVPGLFAGPYGSRSSTHVEDMEFGSMNYMYTAEVGGFAIWYFIHWDDRFTFTKKVWEVAGGKDKPFCWAILHLKSIIVPPRILRLWGIRYFLTQQNPGDLIVTWPGVIHAVLNCSFNIKTANNFIPSDPFLLETILDRKRCKCKFSDYPEIEEPIYEDGSIATPHEKDLSQKFMRLIFRMYANVWDQLPAELSHKQPKIQCDLCEKSFARKQALTRHKKEKHRLLTNSICTQ